MEAWNQRFRERLSRSLASLDNGEMRQASPDDIPLLVSLMAEFYAEGGYELNHARAAGAFSAILADDRLGYVWVIQAEKEDVGHIVLTLRYAMEYGGLIACLDDLYVRPDWRNKGLSTGALVEVRNFCQGRGIRALTVEVGHNNGPAQTVYRRAGFAEAADRQLLALALAAPTHIL
jgi:GNAT superfamily N-acetyltransferase